MLLGPPPCQTRRPQAPRCSGTTLSKAQLCQGEGLALWQAPCLPHALAGLQGYTGMAASCPEHYGSLSQHCSKGKTRPIPHPHPYTLILTLIRSSVPTLNPTLTPASSHVVLTTILALTLNVHVQVGGREQGSCTNTSTAMTNVSYKVTRQRQFRRGHRAHGATDQSTAWQCKLDSGFHVLDVAAAGRR